jgi:hypothetical protein
MIRSLMLAAPVGLGLTLLADNLETWWLYNTQTGVCIASVPPGLLAEVVHSSRHRPIHSYTLQSDEFRGQAVILSEDTFNGVILFSDKDDCVDFGRQRNGR